MRVIYKGETASGRGLRLAHIECEGEYKQARERLNNTSFFDCVLYADDCCIDVEVADKAEFNDFMFEWKKSRTKK